MTTEPSDRDELDQAEEEGDDAGLLGGGGIARTLDDDDEADEHGDSLARADDDQL